jgi:tetratricopeptide (TPR) repeat protein
MSETANTDLERFDSAFAIGDIETAKKIAESMQSADPEAVMTRVVLARLEAVEGDPKAALDTLEALVGEHPKDPLPRAYFGSLLVGLGEPMKAISQLKIALDGGGDVPAAHHAMGVAMLVAGRLDEAHKHLSDAVERMPESAPSHFFLGQVYEAQGEVEPAGQQYARSVEIEPRYVDGWVGRARLKAMFGRLDLAKEAIDEGLEHNPGDGTLMRLRVQAAVDSGDVEGAQKALDDIPEEERIAEDWCNMAVLELQASRWEAALSYAKRGAETDAEHWWPPYLEGLAQEGEGAEREVVIAAYERAIDLGDAFGEAGTRLGFLLLTGEPEERDPPRAVATLEQAAERNGGAPGTLLNLSIACENAGDNVRAQELASEVAKHPHARPGEVEQAEKILDALKS